MANSKNHRPAEGMGISVPTAIAGMIITGLLGFGIARWTMPESQGGEAGVSNVGAAAPGEIFNIPVGNSFTLGKQDAKVTMMIFSDYQCPYCAKVEPVLKQLKEKYGDDLRIVWKDLPLKNIHPNATPAAIAARAAGKQGVEKFWKMHDILFENQKEFSGRGNTWTAAQFEKFAAQVPGLNIEQWKKDIEDKTIAAAVEADVRLATQFGVTGTPAFFINGEFVKGGGDVQKFSAVIDRQKARAEELLAKGIPGDRLYAELTKGGLTQAGAKQAGPAKADPNAIYKVPVPADSPFKGPKDAKVTIIEFSDFQCPFCTRVAVPTTDRQGNPVEPSLPKVMEAYGNDVKLVFRHNPLNSIHPQAHLAAQASMAAHEQGKFWEYHDLLFQNQRQLSRPDLERYAEQIGLDMAKFRAALDSGKFKAKVDADQADAMKFGSPSTPGFFINGRYLRGAASFEQFKAIIDQEIKKADELLAKGVPLSNIYTELTKNGLDRAQAAAAPNPRPRLDPNAVYKIPVDENDAQKGAKDALVTIVEFSEFQCPFCARAALPYTDPRSGTEVKPAIPDILAKYGNKVRFVFKHFPLPKHTDAHLAAQASLAAKEQGKFWEYHDLLFQNQRALKRPDLEKYAEQLGLDMTRFRAALDTGKYKAQVDADFKLGQSIGVPGTPTFYVNGKSLNAAPTVEGFSAVIEAELKKAEEMLSQGVAPKDVYNKIIENGATAPVYLPSPGTPAAARPSQPGAQPGGTPRVIQLPQVNPGQPIVIQGGGGKAPVITTPAQKPNIKAEQEPPKQ